MATSTDAQQPVAKPVVHPSSSPAKTERQISDGRDSPHPTDTSVIRREAVIRATAAASGSSTPRGQSPLTLVSATAGSSSRTASPITHLEEARGECCVRVSLSLTHTHTRTMYVSFIMVSCVLSNSPSFGQLAGGQIYRVDDGGGRNGARSQASLHWEQG